MNMPKQPPKIFQGQALHLGSLVFLLSIVFIVWGTLGKPNGEIFWFSIFIPILHQVFVWLTWRIELSSAGVSKTIGTKSYYIIFFLFLVSRVVSIFALGWQNSHSIILSDVIQLGSSLSLGLSLIHI